MLNETVSFYRQHRSKRHRYVMTSVRHSSLQIETIAFGTQTRKFKADKMTHSQKRWCDSSFWNLAAWPRIAADWRQNGTDPFSSEELNSPHRQ